MRALIDADIIPYEFGGMVQLESPEKPLEWEITRHLVDERIKGILKVVKATEKSLYLTDSESNFRIGVATIKPYKGHRNQEKPYHWERIRQHLIDNWDAEVQYGIEADDRLGIEQMAAMESNPGDDHGTVICSRDKDLNMIPGWHYVWPAGKQEEKLWYQTDTEAIRCFYKQLLTGDTTDNILGLYGVGSNSSLVKKIDTLEDEFEMFKLVLKAYEDRFGTYGLDFMEENAALLWILRKKESIDATHITEVYDRFSDMISMLQESSDDEL